MKKEIDVFDYADTILKGLKDGALLTVKADGRVNSMAVAWGMLGFEWNRPIFTAFVRKSRYTSEIIAKNPEFTINIALGEADKKIIGLCGSKSGRDTDKIKELGLTLEDGESVSVPGIRQMPLTLECKIIYKSEQDITKLKDEYARVFYPGNGLGRDLHTEFYGEIVNAYIIED